MSATPPLPARDPVFFVLPGNWLTRTGGYRYDRRIVLGLRAAGRPVDLVALHASFPQPSAAALEAADAVFAAMPEGALVIVDSLAFGAMPAIAARHAPRLRMVALVHHPLWLETGLPSELAQRLRASERDALAHAGRVIVTSPATVQAVIELGVPRERIGVVEPGTDPAPLALPQPGPLRLLCAATLTPRKGHTVLIEALAGLRDRQWRLSCHGSLALDPAHAAAVREAVAQRGLQDRIVLPGEADDAALAAAYADADVFVLPSFYEGYGMVLSEALARGLPIVSTTGGAIPRTVPRDAGLLVPPGDAVALRGALAQLMDDPAALARLRAGAQAAREHLATWDDAVARFAEEITAHGRNQTTWTAS